MASLKSSNTGDQTFLRRSSQQVPEILIPTPDRNRLSPSPKPHGSEAFPGHPKTGEPMRVISPARKAEIVNHPYANKDRESVAIPSSLHQPERGSVSDLTAYRSMSKSMGNMGISTERTVNSFDTGDTYPAKNARIISTSTRSTTSRNSLAIEIITLVDDKNDINDWSTMSINGSTDEDPLSRTSSSRINYQTSISTASRRSYDTVDPTFHHPRSGRCSKKKLNSTASEGDPCYFHPKKTLSNRSAKSLNVQNI